MFTIRPCYIQDAEEVLSFLKEFFYPEEPLIKSNSLQDDIVDFTKDILPQGHSVAAVSETGKIVGVAINEEPPQKFPNIYTNTNKDTKFQELFKYVERESGVLTVAPGALEILVLAVDTKWRKLGVATALYEATSTHAFQAGFSFVKMYCTSAHTIKLVTDRWEPLYSLSYSRYLEEHPSGIIPPPEPHTHCELFVAETKVYQPPDGASARG